MLVTCIFSFPLTHYQMTILDSSKLKEFADDSFKSDENERKLSKQVESTVGKEEIARYEQFLLFPQCFQKASFPGVSKGVIVWECVNVLYVFKGEANHLSLFSDIFQQHFLLFPQCFLPVTKKKKKFNVMSDI